MCAIHCKRTVACPSQAVNKINVDLKSSSPGWPKKLTAGVEEPKTVLGIIRLLFNCLMCQQIAKPKWLLLCFKIVMTKSINKASVRVHVLLY